MVTNCHQLKSRPQDGKYRLTDVTDMVGMFKINESNLGERIVTKDNRLNYQYIDEKQIENK